MNASQNREALDDEERRSHTRHETTFKATVDDVQHGPLAFIASAFSQNGTFLQRVENSTPLPPVGKLIQVVLHWPLETDAPPVRVLAKVVHQREDGVGVRFEIHSQPQAKAEYVLAR